MNIIYATKKHYIEQCKKIAEKGDKADFDDLGSIEKIINKDNTEPLIVQTYLRLISKYKNDKFSEQINKYLVFLPKELIKEQFPNYYSNKFPSSDLFIEIWKSIERYNDDWSLILKIIYYKKFGLFEMRDDDIKGFTDYTKNKELMMYILVRRILNGIIKPVQNIDISEASIEYQQKLSKIQEKLMIKI